ncbi:MAG: type II toxin-antitoxin system RelB/DinJ family antitoxin [Nitrosomonadaceae bacterium]
MTNKEAIIKACVTSETKAKAMVILNAAGLTTSEFIRLVFEQLIKNHEIHGGMITIKLPEKENT